MHTANGQENMGKIDPENRAYFVGPDTPLPISKNAEWALRNAQHAWEWTPYNPTKPQTWPMDEGWHLITECAGVGPPVTTEAYWCGYWLAADPMDEENCQLCDVTAWMPLPEPYKEGE